MDPVETAAQLENWARDAGFDRAGVASLEPLAGAAALERWLSRGDHAGMVWMERRREERGDPRRLLPGARSALCVALQYHPLEGEEEPVGDLWPRVARYARGRDYHNLMGKRLKRLARRVREAFPGEATRPYVDTGPLLERELAARAGLGAVGKNTNLLHPEGGSWFLLGEILTTLSLAPSPPVADLCGSCTRCLEACPTGALPEAYRLDAGLCISYWTIEHRGELPPPIRPLLGDWVFGCDICQEVCPVNAAPMAGAHPDLQLPPHRGALDLVALLRLDQAGYRRRFHGSPMQRATLPGLKRNAAVVMGNRGEERYVAPLGEVLAGGDELLRRHAAWALGRIGGAAARRQLERALAGEPSPSVRREIGAALERSRPAGGEVDC